MTRANRKAEAGFTLLEVLITMVLLAVGILGVGGLAITTVQGNDKSNRLSAATMLAQDKLEQVRTAGYTGAPALAGTEGYGAIADNTPFKREVAVADDTPTIWMRTVTVTVWWESDGHSVTLSTIVAKEFT
jgi:type IV pilus assembly protein PilV